MGFDQFPHVRRIDADTIGFHKEDMTRLARMKYTATIHSIIGADGTGTRLRLKCNNTNTYSYLDIYGDGGISAWMPSNSSGFSAYGATTLVGQLRTGGSNVGGQLKLKETTTPTATADMGALYTKADNHLYFQDGAGAEHDMGSP